MNGLPRTLTTRNHLAHWQGMAGDPFGAAAALQELLLDCQRVLSDDHPETLKTRRNLAHWQTCVPQQDADLDTDSWVLTCKNR